MTGHQISEAVCDSHTGNKRHDTADDNEILEKHPGVDPYEWAKQYAKTLTDKEKEKKAKIVAKFEFRRNYFEEEVYTWLISLCHARWFVPYCRLTGPG